MSWWVCVRALVRSSKIKHPQKLKVTNSANTFLIFKPHFEEFVEVILKTFLLNSFGKIFYQTLLFSPFVTKSRFPVVWFDKYSSTINENWLFFYKITVLNNLIVTKLSNTQTTAGRLISKTYKLIITIDNLKKCIFNQLL